MIELQQLVLVKQLANEAERQLAQNSAFRHGVAVSLMQDAVELFLRVVIRQHDPTTEKNAKFDQLADAIDKAAKDDQSKVPFRPRLEDLNKTRVNFKHMGTAPSAADAQRLVRYGIEFLEVAFPRLMKIDFESVSLSDMLRTEAVRNAMKSAERHLSVGTFDQAIKEAALAVALSERGLAGLIPEPDANLRNFASAVGDASVKRIVDQGTDYLVKYLSRMRTVMLATTLGFDPRELRMFRLLTPTILMSGSNSIQTVSDRLSAPTVEQATFCVDFARRFSLASDTYLDHADVEAALLSDRQRTRLKLNE